MKNNLFHEHRLICFKRSPGKVPTPEQDNQTADQSANVDKPTAAENVVNDIDNALKNVPDSNKIRAAMGKNADSSVQFNKATRRNELVVYSKDGEFIDRLDSKSSSFAGDLIKASQKATEDPREVLREGDIRAARGLLKQPGELRTLLQYADLNGAQTEQVKQYVQSALGLEGNIIINSMQESPNATLPKEFCVLDADSRQLRAVFTLNETTEGGRASVSIEHIRNAPTINELPKATLVSLLARLTGNSRDVDNQAINNGKLDVNLIRVGGKSPYYEAEVKSDGRTVGEATISMLNQIVEAKPVGYRIKG